MADLNQTNPILQQAQQNQLGQLTPLEMVVEATDMTATPIPVVEIESTPSSVTGGINSSMTMKEVSSEPVLSIPEMRVLADDILEQATGTAQAVVTSAQKQVTTQQLVADSINEAATAQSAIVAQAAKGKLETQTAKRDIAKASSRERVLLAKVTEQEAALKLSSDKTGVYQQLVNTTIKEHGFIAYAAARGRLPRALSQMNAANAAVNSITAQIEAVNRAATAVDKAITSTEEIHTEATIGALDTKLKALADAAYAKSQTEMLKTNSEATVKSFELSREGIATAISLQNQATTSLNAKINSARYDIARQSADNRAAQANVVRERLGLPLVDGLDIISGDAQGGQIREDLAAQSYAGFGILNQASQKQAAIAQEAGVPYSLDLPLGETSAQALDTALDFNESQSIENVPLSSFSKRIEADTMLLLRKRAGGPGADISGTPQAAITSATNEVIAARAEAERDLITPDSFFAAAPYPTLEKFASVRETTLHKTVYAPLKMEAVDPQHMYNLAVEAVRKGDIKIEEAARDLSDIFQAAINYNNNYNGFGRLLLESQSAYPVLLEGGKKLADPTDLSSEIELIGAMSAAIAGKGESIVDIFMRRETPIQEQLREAEKEKLFPVNPGTIDTP